MRRAAGGGAGVDLIAWLREVAGRAEHPHLADTRLADLAGEQRSAGPPAAVMTACVNGRDGVEGGGERCGARVGLGGLQHTSGVATAHAEHSRVAPAHT